MDIFKQKRYLVLVVILLVFMNLTTLTLLWIGRPEAHRQQRSTKDPIEEQKRMQQLLKMELGFDKIQTEHYLRLRQKHHEQTRQLNDEMRRIKKQMFDEVLQDNPQPTLSDSLLRLTQEKQAKIEQMTFQHFLDLKKLCKPEQQKKLQVLMHELFRRHPGGKDEGHPPPLPKNDRPPRNK